MIIIEESYLQTFLHRPDLIKPEIDRLSNMNLYKLTI